jgi:hypothetical protein
MMLPSSRMKVSELKAEMEAAFRAVDERFETVTERFRAVDQRFSELEAHITTEGERTRRHFDIVAERLETKFSTVLAVLADQTPLLF